MKTLSELFDDNTSGSVALLKQFANILSKNLLKPDSQWQKTLAADLTLAGNRWPHFRVIHHLIKSMKTEAFSSPELTIQWIDGYLATWNNIHHKWADQMQKLLKADSQPIAVHSHSESVKSTLKELHTRGYSFQVLQTLSGPANEGILQARALADSGLNVTLLTDAMSAFAVKKSGLVLLGADGLYPSGFMNKSGSLNICLAADLYKIPVYVLIDSRKISEGFPETETARSTEEIITNAPPNLDVINFYFELVPHTYVSGYITESGLKNSGDLFPAS